MSLSPGSRIGHYEIIGSLGAGGMGEVYRARDTRLGRDVAIKLLPDSFVSDPDRLARFEREARTLASLNHPNIAQIYGMEERALVMELVAGDDLSALIARGPMPVPEALAIARQIADALETAHEQGIVHRDLKPANVKVKADGTVKVLDFGLAKALAVGPDDAGHQSNSANSPTLTSHGTQLGVILGTAAYMAPEQARGKPVDRRADVWAFGLVVFEMLTGRRAFEGDEVSDVLAAVLRQELDFTQLPAATPSSVRRLLKRCLERDPRKRLSSIGDARLDIDETDAPTTAAAAAPTPIVLRRVPVGLVIAAVVVAVAAFFAGKYMPASQTSSPASSAPLLALQQVTDAAGLETDPALSPDGTSIAFARSLGRLSDIFVQRVGGRAPIPIATDPVLNEGGPAFSPNGESIAFYATGGNDRGGIFVAGATGESARRLSGFGFHPAWSPDGKKVIFCTELIGSPYSRTSTSELWTVDAKGGADPVNLFKGDAVEPAWSPNNKRIAFWAADTGQRDIFTIPVEGGAVVPLTNDAAVDWGPKWSSDGRYVYFSSDRGGAMNIWRIAIDESSGKPAGSPEPVTQGVSASEQVTLSRDGNRIAFRSGVFSSNPATIQFDEAAERLGPVKQLFDRTGNMMASAASPDGKWIAYWNIGDRIEDVFIAQPDGSGLRRLTDDVFRDRFGAWTPDSKEVLFYSNRSGVYNIWAIRPDGGGLRAVTERPGGNDANLLYPVISPTGDRMVASRTRSNESIMIDPRRPWSSQTAQKLDMAVGTDSWLLPNQWSPDGARLLGPILNGTGAPTGVGLYDFATRKVRVVTNDLVDYVGFAWLSDSRRVLVHLNDDLVLLDVDTGRRKVMSPGVHLGLGLTLSHDRKLIYVTISREQADIWLGEKK